MKQGTSLIKIMMAMFFESETDQFDQFDTKLKFQTLTICGTSLIAMVDKLTINNCE